MPYKVEAGPTPPPKRSTSTSTPKPRASQPPTQEDIRTRRTQGLNEFAQLFTLPLMAVNLWADAATINHFTPTITAETAKLAERYEKLAAPIDKLIAVTPFTELGMAIVSMGLQLAVNHGKLPAGTMGTQDPQVLGGRFRMQVEHQMQMQQMQMEAERLAYEREREEFDLKLQELRDPVKE